jgi:hypothetical protein
MRSVEFLYWLLGGIELGSMKNQHDDTKEIILKHIKMVEAYKPNQQDKCYSLVMMIKGLVNLASINEGNIEELCFQIQEQTPQKIEQMGTTFLPYYIQGGFELAASFNDIQLTESLINPFPMCSLHRSINFYFFISSRKDWLTVAELLKLKTVIGNIFRDEIDPTYGKQIAELNAIHNPKKTKLIALDDDYTAVDFHNSDSNVYRC